MATISMWCSHSSVVLGAAAKASRNPATPPLAARKRAVAGRWER